MVVMQENAYGSHNSCDIVCCVLCTYVYFEIKADAKDVS